MIQVNSTGNNSSIQFMLVDMYALYTLYQNYTIQWTQWSFTYSHIIIYIYIKKEKSAGWWCMAFWSKRAIADIYTIKSFIMLYKRIDFIHSKNVCYHGNVLSARSWRPPLHIPWRFFPLNCYFMHNPTYTS